MRVNTTIAERVIEEPPPLPPAINVDLESGTIDLRNLFLSNAPLLKGADDSVHLNIETWGPGVMHSLRPQALAASLLNLRNFFRQQ